MSTIEHPCQFCGKNDIPIIDIGETTLKHVRYLCSTCFEELKKQQAMSPFVTTTVYFFTGESLSLEIHMDKTLATVIQQIKEDDVGKTIVLPDGHTWGLFIHAQEADGNSQLDDDIYISDITIQPDDKYDKRSTKLFALPCKLPPPTCYECGDVSDKCIKVSHEVFSRVSINIDLCVSCFYYTR